MHGMREWFLESSARPTISVRIEVDISRAVIGVAWVFVKCVLGAVWLRDKVHKCFGVTGALA